jgi:penicillin-binding protein 2
MNNDSPRLRLGILGLVMLSLFATLFARLWYLQILAHDEFSLQATANRERVILEQAPRGRILDRNMNVLVDNRVSIVVTVDRNKLPKAGKPERDTLLDRLALEISTFTGKALTREEIERRLNDVRYSPYTPVPVTEDVPKELQLYIDEHHEEFGDAVDVTSTTIRNYPLARTASHVLGYVGSITQEELDTRTRDPKSYSLDDEIGKTGVERAYEGDLRGLPGRRVLEVDARGNTVRQLSYTPAVPGNDLVLTIDKDVQATTEHALAEELRNAFNSRNSDGSYNTSPAGSSVVLDPTNGQVIAMASFPDYDPAEFTKPIQTPRWDELNNPSNHYPLNNRALQGQYAPGSTFKLITAYAALRSGAISGGSTISDPGYYTVPGCKGEQCTFRNAGSQSHGRVNVTRALTVSSDVFFYSLGGRFWTERSAFGDPIQDAAKAFGLGEETGIPLAGELKGWVPTPDNKKERHAKNPTAFPYGDWFTGDNINLSIGQGDMLVTPLQLANAYAALANGGTLFSPNVVIKVLAPGGAGTVVRNIDPRVLKTIEMPPEVREPIVEGLTGVTTQQSGTAYAAFIGFPGDWQVAGKTGTAQVTGGSDNALFVGFGPTVAPRYVSAAVLENSGFGAVHAAPTVRRVLQGLADPAQQPTVGPGGQYIEPVPVTVNANTGVQD